MLVYSYLLWDGSVYIYFDETAPVYEIPVYEIPDVYQREYEAKEEEYATEAARLEEEMRRMHQEAADFAAAKAKTDAKFERDWWIISEEMRRNQYFSSHGHFPDDNGDREYFYWVYGEYPTKNEQGFYDIHGQYPFRGRLSEERDIIPSGWRPANWSPDVSSKYGAAASQRGQTANLPAPERRWS